MPARTATVQNICALPGSPLKPITKGPVSAKLNTISFTVDGTTEKARHRYTDVDPVTGSWSMVLELNDDLDPAGTSWVIKEPTGATWTVQLVAANAGQTVNLRDVIVADPLNPNPIVAGASIAALSAETSARVSGDAATLASAATDASTKASAAQAAAISAAATDAATKAGAAQSAAVATAATDATGKANAAQAAAIAAAAADATAKDDAVKAFVASGYVARPTGATPGAVPVVGSDGTTVTFDGTALSTALGDARYLGLPGGSPGAYTLPRGTGTGTATQWTTVDALIAQKFGWYPATLYGTLDPAASSTTNAATIQAAQDAAEAAGGGRVWLPAGTYQAKGILQGSRVELFGPKTKLVHPDGISLDIVKAKLTNKTGSIAAGSNSLTVNSTSGTPAIEVGSVVGVQGAGGLAPLQFTTLVADITAAQTAGIQITESTGYATGGNLQVGSEILSYTGLTAFTGPATLTGVTRGVLGTTAATHTNGDWIGTSMRLITEVTAVSGTTVTLKDVALLAVAGAQVTVGVLKPKITGVTFDGARVAGGSPNTLNAIRWDLARWGEIAAVHVDNAEAAVYWAQGTRDCVADHVRAYQCSVPEGAKGSAFWLFQSCVRNRVTNFRVSGDVWVGFYLDNRTSHATEWDGPCDDNTLDGFVVNANYSGSFITNVAVNVVGSNRNKFLNGSVVGIRTGFACTNTDQVYTADASLPTTANNQFAHWTMAGIYQPWVFTAPNNSGSFLYYASAANGINTGNNNLWFCSTAPGGALTFGALPAGTQSAPGVAIGESNTGFYKLSAGTVEFVSQAIRIARLWASGLMMVDTSTIMTIDTGSTNGTRIGAGTTSKLAFYGRTPIIQQTRSGQLTDSSGGTAGSTVTAAPAAYTQSDEAVFRASVAAKLNALDTILHNLGLTS